MELVEYVIVNPIFFIAIGLIVVGGIALFFAKRTDEFGRRFVQGAAGFLVGTIAFSFLMPPVGPDANTTVLLVIALALGFLAFLRGVGIFEMLENFLGVSI